MDFVVFGLLGLLIVLGMVTVALAIKDKTNFKIIENQTESIRDLKREIEIGKGELTQKSMELVNYRNQIENLSPKDSNKVKYPVMVSGKSGEQKTVRWSDGTKSELKSKSSTTNKPAQSNTYYDEPNPFLTTYQSDWIGNSDDDLNKHSNNSHSHSHSHSHDTSSSSSSHSHSSSDYSSGSSYSSDSGSSSSSDSGSSSWD